MDTLRDVENTLRSFGHNIAADIVRTMQKSLLQRTAQTSPEGQATATPDGAPIK